MEDRVSRIDKQGSSARIVEGVPIDLGQGELSFFQGEAEGSAERPCPGLCWDILVADDEDDAREAARIALDGIELLGRPLRLSYARSAVEAMAALQANPKMAVALLDVVMETSSAGLDLVKAIRSQPRWDALRIILRTGQPGYAPELEVAKLYDINDYKAKSEMTQAKLVASLASALRAHAQIEALKWQSERLRDLAQASGSLIQAGSDPIQAAAQAAKVARSALGDCELAVGAREEGREWLVACVGMGSEGRWGWSDPDAPGLAEFAKFGESESSAAIGLRAALDSGSTRPVEMGDLGRARMARSGEVSIAIWWRPMGERSGADRQALFDAYCACVASALESASQRSLARRAAFWDELTDLPNRAWLMERIEKSPRERRSGQSLLFVDLVGFSGVNDALGYEAGDAMLREAGASLRASLPGCEVARMPGGAFAALGDSALIDEEMVARAFEAPIKAAGWEMPMKVQMGRATLGARKDSRQSLNEANMALNAVKAQGLGGPMFRIHDDELDREARERHKIAKDLKKALRGAGGLSLYYQPQVSMASGRAVGVEALARWRAADGTMIPPSRFVQIAEACGLVGELGDWALGEACRQARAWRDAGFEMPIAVNVSPLQMESAGIFLDKLAACLDLAGCEPDWIELEITEAAAMADAGQARLAIEEARKWGCRAALDDFGTGFSSLGRLADWPLDKLKIDRSLVAPLVNDPKGRSIARMVMGLGSELGLAVVAEGVETREQSALLQEMGVDLAQGWLYCPALPEIELTLACSKGFA